MCVPFLHTKQLTEQKKKCCINLTIPPTAGMVHLLCSFVPFWQWGFLSFSSTAVSTCTLSEMSHCFNHFLPRVSVPIKIKQRKSVAEWQFSSKVMRWQWVCGSITASAEWSLHLGIHLPACSFGKGTTLCFQSILRDCKGHRRLSCSYIHRTHDPTVFMRVCVYVCVCADGASWWDISLLWLICWRGVQCQMSIFCFTASLDILKHTHGCHPSVRLYTWPFW